MDMEIRKKNKKLKNIGVVEINPIRHLLSKQNKIFNLPYFFILFFCFFNIFFIYAFRYINLGIWKF
jgi:hypothetical protein